MKQQLAIFFAGLFLIGFLGGCGDADEDVNFVNDGPTVFDTVDDEVEDVVELAEDSDDSLGIEEDDDGTLSIPGTTTSFFIPDNCDNPPTEISSNDGFQCIASRTRNDSLVCLLPFQFTWPPLVSFRDDAGFVFGCNANDDFFDDVTVILSDGQQIPLVESGCFNFVATADGQIGRQHWRNENVQFDSVASRLELMVMRRNGLQTCLRF